MIKVENIDVWGFEHAIRGMRKLIKAGNSHRKFLRQIFVSMDIMAPLYWWKEFDTYKIGVTANSCSTMHTIHKKEFTIDDFSCEHLDIKTLEVLKNIINVLNTYKVIYENYNADNFEIKGCPSQKDFLVANNTASSVKLQSEKDCYNELRKCS